MTIGDTVVRVDVTHRDGQPTGLVVPVNVTYVIERGRGEETVEVLDIDIAHYDLIALNSTQVEDLLRSARRHVLARDFRPSLL
jgi:hypothetical protein